jgi:hypothetical protein
MLKRVLSLVLTSMMTLGLVTNVYCEVATGTVSVTKPKVTTKKATMVVKKKLTTLQLKNIKECLNEYMDETNDKETVYGNYYGTLKDMPKYSALSNNYKNFYVQLNKWSGKTGDLASAEDSINKLINNSDLSSQEISNIKGCINAEKTLSNNACKLSKELEKNNFRKIMAKGRIMADYKDCSEKASKYAKQYNYKITWDVE